MKKSISIFLATFLFLGMISLVYYGCKKKEETPPPQVPAHCSDGIIDQGELDTDCGGECSACAAITAPCTPTSNTASLSGSPTLNITYVSCLMDHGNYVMTGNSSNGDIVITLSGAMPTVDRAYFFKPGAGPSTILDEGQATIQMCKGFAGCFYASTGKLYVAIKSGKVEVTFCNITFNGDQTSGNFTGTGRVICQ